MRPWTQKIGVDTAENEQKRENGRPDYRDPDSTPLHPSKMFMENNGNFAWALFVKILIN